ncbi:hypothetical protein Clacol_003981 [Clathrus columnatus]|uniref:UDP-Glycosyltransferase/glycogen phosphorylase n=1 Tax=Clathrus columnatus TaxID=1419009 RepID=A0AAV5A7Y0_9AGAM|nr:hypothetical protein Clacol_003981 [Clathrus columnatus]
MAITKSLSRHVLLISAPGWGHLKPLTALAAKFVHEQPDIIVTFIVTSDFRPKLEKELDAFFNNDEQSLKDNIRLLHVGGFEGNLMEIFQPYCQGLAEIYPAIYAEEALHCATGRVYPAISKPDVILLDPFQLDTLHMIRKVSGKTIPIIAWNTAALNAFLRLFGPESFGGLGNVGLKAEIIAKETGRSKHEIAMELYDPETGELVELPGLPPMYDYEFSAQHEDVISLTIPLGNDNNFSNGGLSADLPKGFMRLLKLSLRSLKECDGIIALGNATFDPAICEAYRTWFALRPAYFVGPLSKPDDAKDLTASSNDTEVKVFLDTIQKSHGDYSLLYISFGSIFWPIGESVWKIIEVVLNMKIPLILSYSPKRAEMPSHLHKQLEASDISLVLEWAPQDVILGHSATAWFLTHCGNNSVTESVSSGVPMITWPLSADQPVNAAYMSSTLNIAYELFETRRGPGLLPLHQGIKPQGTLEAIEKEIQTILEKAWSPDGVQKRENLHVLTKKINKAWNDNGEARIEFRKFLKRFVPN